MAAPMRKDPFDFSLVREPDIALYPLEDIVAARPDRGSREH